MKNNRIILLFILFVPLSIFLGSARAGSAQSSTYDGSIATLRVTADTLTWTPVQAFGGLLLEISLPSGSVETHHFGAGDSARLTASTSERALPDGSYAYQLTAYPQVDEATLKYLASIRDAVDREHIVAEMQASGELSVVPPAMSGSFMIRNGAFFLGGAQRGEEEPPPPGDQLFDIIHADDVIINGGSLCVGFDCVNGESFGFDTLRQKENNIRIHIQDTSASASFPTNDWRLVFNDTSNGGAEYFAVEDTDAARQIFRLEAGAPASALYVDSGGDVGIGTSTPALELSVKDGDTPSIRLEQDGTSGWTPQTWDMAGNETNFFIRDVTNGSSLTFRIRPGAPGNSIYVAADGKIGLGTASPTHALEVVGSSSLGDGNVLVDGYVTELSSVDAKQNFSAVDGTDVLERLANMPIQTWTYRSESEDILHMGPTAQDFHAAFQLGQDERHIASIDSTGVALAAIQGLNANLRDAQAEITALEAQNSELENRLSRLEAAVEGRGDASGPQPGILALAVQAAAVAGLFLAGILAGKHWKGARQHVD